MNILGTSKAIRMLCESIRMVAPRDARVLILGECGTGKELVAKAIHAESARATEPYLTLNCSAIPESLFESELFGHEKGAFTGASAAKVGYVERANGGTLFLDEIGDLPFASQAKLLRLLQEGEYEKVGGRRTEKANIRVVAATNKSLMHEVEQGRFRNDLYHRLAVHVVTVPALRDRTEDVPILLQHYGPQLNYATTAISTLQAYKWPGNVRELVNFSERMQVRFDSGAAINGSDVIPVLHLDRVYTAVAKVRKEPTRDLLADILQELKSLVGTLMGLRESPPTRVAETEQKVSEHRTPTVGDVIVQDGRRAVIEEIDTERNEVLVMLVGVSDLPLVPLQEEVWSLQT